MTSPTTASDLGRSGTVSGPSELLVVCTGNAARSVMAGFMLEQLAEGRRPVRVITAGTHAVDGQPMGMRTRDALVAIPDMAGAPVARHRSHQLADRDLGPADLVIGMEADHIRYIRRHHPAAAARAATLRRFARDLPTGPGPLGERVASMALADREPDGCEDVVDPAGGDEAAYRACAEELWVLTSALAARL